MIYLIDNYDSFSYNLYQMIGELYPAIKVLRNDAMTAQEVVDEKPEAIILSPGPGRPIDAGICEELSRIAGDIPTLGVCLGHQAMCEAAGGTIVHAKRLMHGKQSVVKADLECPLFKDLPEEFPVGRYHSLSVKEDELPAEFKVTAKTLDDGEIMAVQHVSRPLYGMQFHPESILTPQGKIMLRNFLEAAGIATCWDPSSSNASLLDHVQN